MRWLCVPRSRSPGQRFGARCLSILLATACCASLSHTRAQSSEEAAADGGDEYRAVIEQALEEFNLGNWDEAAVLFERAHGINPSARTQRGMGMAAFEARHYAAAITHFSAALREQRNPLTATQRADLERALRRAQDYIARLALDVTPSDARVRINGQAVEPDPHGDRLLDPGLQELEIAADGYETELRRVQLASGKRETLIVKLRPLPSAAALAPAPSAAISGSADAPSPSSLRTWKWAVGASGLAGLAAGGAFLLAQRAQAQGFNDMCDRSMLTQTCASIERSADLWSASAIVSLSIGTGLLATSALLFMLDGASQQPDHAQDHGCQLGFGDVGVVCKLTL